jgi:hypothetical protein
MLIPRTSITHFAASLAVLVTAACSPAIEGPTDIRSSARENGQAFVVLSDTVRLEVSATGYFMGRIPFRFMNEGDRAVGVSRCHSPYPPNVDVVAGASWRQAWSGIVLACYQAPLEIAPGATYHDTLRVGGCLRSAPSCGPRWEADTSTTEARLVWMMAPVTRTAGGEPVLVTGARADSVISTSFVVRFTRK